MGWFIDGAEGHEGYVANVLQDGRTGSGTTSGGVVMLHATPADEAAGWVRRHSYGDEAVVPWNEVTTWRVTCECGWQGSSRQAEEDPDGSRYCPQAIEDEFAREWEGHVQPFTGLTEVARLTEEARGLDRQLDVAVDVARASGASWAAIGEAAGGLTRQGAQQRWGRPTELVCPACHQTVSVTVGQYGGNVLAAHTWPGRDKKCVNGSGQVELSRKAR